jgi:hypothetical protein
MGPMNIAFFFFLAFLNLHTPHAAALPAEPSTHAARRQRSPLPAAQQPPPAPRHATNATCPAPRHRTTCPAHASRTDALAAPPALTCYLPCQPCRPHRPPADPRREPPAILRWPMVVLSENSSKLVPSRLRFDRNSTRIIILIKKRPKFEL